MSTIQKDNEVNDLIDETIKSICKRISDTRVSNGMEYAETIKALAMLVEARANSKEYRALQNERQRQMCKSGNSSASFRQKKEFESQSDVQA